MKKLTFDYKDSKIKKEVQEIIIFMGGYIDEQYDLYEYNNLFTKLEKKLNNDEELKEHSRCFLDIAVSKIFDCDMNRTFQEIEILDKNEESIFENDVETNSMDRATIEFVTGLEILNSNHIYIYNCKYNKLK